MDTLIAMGVKVDAIITDPPYGTTGCKWDSVIPFDEMWKRLNELIKDKHAVVLFGSEPFSSRLRCSNIKNFKYDWIWNKKLAGNGILAKKQPLKIHEIISVFNSNIYYPIMRQGKYREKMSNRLNTNNCELLSNSNTEVNMYKNDLYYPVSIQEFTSANLRTGRYHPTQKPVDLMEYLVKTYTNENDTVLDFTMGSGTTGVACKRLNRNFIGIELDDKYYNIAKERIDNA
jgi:site-specific DNA-methyltransferase (adenine-specific)